MEKKLIFGIHCDLSPKSGLGHFNRMKSIYLEIKKKQHNCYFFFNNSNKQLTRDQINKFDTVLIGSKSANDNVKKITKKVIELNISILITDSYIINYNLEKILYSSGVFLVSIDDHLKRHYSDLVINCRASVSKDEIRYIKNQSWITGAKYTIINSVKKSNRLKKKPSNILFHSGGLSFFKKHKEFYISSLKKLDNLSLGVSILCTTLNSEIYINNLIKKLNLKKNIIVLKFSKDLRKNLFKYDIVAGPAGSITYESIISGSLPFSFPFKQDGRDCEKSWNSLGHLMHLNEKEKKNKRIIDMSWELIFDKYQKLILILKKYSRELNVKSSEYILKKIIFIYNKKKNTSLVESIKINNNLYYSKKAKIDSIRGFLISRNQKNVRDLSSNPKNIISWPEHLSWWLNKKIEKFNIFNNDKIEAYHWIKERTDNNGKYIVSGWFPDKYCKDKLKTSFKVVYFQKNYLKKKFKNRVWVIIIKKKNLLSLRLNKNIGFNEGSKLSIERAKKSFSINDNLKDYEILEMKL